MKRYAVPMLACLAALGGLMALPGGAQEQPPQQQVEEPTIRVDVQVVNLLATVRDKKGVLRNDLSKDDFDLYEDGDKQEIKYFSRQTDLPLTIGLLVDTSVSQERVVDVERSAGYRFFDKILRKEKDLAFLMSFDIDVELLQDLTASKNLLEDGLEKLQIQGATGGITPGPVPTGKVTGTALYDSIYLAAREMLKPQVGRKAIVLVSDGNDYGSKVDIDEAIEAAQRSDVIIFGVRYFDREFYFHTGAMGGGGMGTLKKLARGTGGDVFEVDRKHTLDSILDEINEVVRNQYAIGYSPTRDLSEQGFRKIELKTRDKGLEVQTREGYYPSEVN